MSDVEEDDYEQFGMSEFDMAAAMDPRSRKRMTKNQQIYGVWAPKESSGEEEEEDEGARPGFGRTKGKKSKNYSAPIGFVKGGVKHGDKIEREGEGPSEPVDKEEEEIIQILSQREARAKQKREGQKFAGDMSFAGMRGAQAASSKVGNWEAHTKGIGSKLMEQMGYQKGKGLGREGRGITAPVEVMKRPGRGAIGAYGPEKKAPPIKPTAPGANNFEMDDEEEAPKKTRGLWKKNVKPVKYKYKTVDEVIADGGVLKKRVDSAVHSSTKVIDMTGKEQKVYSGYNVLASKTREAEEEATERRGFDVPELVYNLDLLVNLTEEEILRNHKQLEYLKDQVVTLKHERDSLNDTINTEGSEIDRGKQVFELIEKFATKEARGELTLDSCGELIKTLQDKYYTEYKMFGLGQVVITNVLPLIKNIFEGWEPLKDPKHGLGIMKEWKELLEDPTVSGSAQPVQDMDLYHRLVWEGWMPPVRRATLGWNPREFEPMLVLIETWMSLLPSWILENLLELQLLPRIQTEVDEWDPLTDVTPLHTWLHPWLSFLGDRLLPVYAPIRHKLGRALVQWHPRDPSAKIILLPWKDVFSQTVNMSIRDFYLKGSMDSFLSQHIVPKLDLVLKQMTVNPANQDLNPWKWVMTWLDLLSHSIIAQLLLANFFPKWQQALYRWLMCENPNFKEISSWYTGWKSTLDSSLMEMPLISEQFKYALEMMNNAVSGAKIGPPAGNPAAASWKPPGAPESVAALHARQKFEMEMSTPANFKDLIEKRASERGIAFIPVPNKLREGKPVYRFGNRLVYLDRNVIFLQQDPNNWVPTGLENLIDAAYS